MENKKYKFPVKEILERTENDAENLKKTFVIGTSTRDSSLSGIIDSSEKDLYYQFVYDDETSWFADADTMEDLFANSKKSKRSGSDDAYDLSLTIESDNQNRNAVTSIVLNLIHVFTKPAEDVLVETIARKLEDSHLTNAEGKSTEGLNKLDANFNLIKFTKSKDTLPKTYLLFIHGTNSDTIGAFEGLKKNETYKKINAIYSDNVLAFQHRTLTESPLKNAVDLATALPDNATLHIISHSRGGLVGDILSMYADNNSTEAKGFKKEQKNLLVKEGRTDDTKYIAKLDAIFKNKKIKIEKFIRVASPSAGTILASDRMDHILNVFFNLMGKKTSIIATLTHDLIGSILKQKDNTKVLPGLEAMNPESPFIKVLNYHYEKKFIEGNSLMVISGNGKVSINFHGLLVILGKLFYLRRNDLVVNTDSMYLGAPRKDEIQYFFDEGTNVDHVHYFDNKKTQDAILNALKTSIGQTIPGYKKVEQRKIPASDRGVLGIDGGELHPSENPAVSGKRPIVILLPGIMGSNIYSSKNKLWLNYWGIIGGNLTQMGTQPNATANSVIKSSYEKINKQLQYSYDVVIFPFDWRKPMDVLAASLDKKVQELLKHKQPIKIVGHSMGGVLVRDFMVYHPTTWETLNKSKDFKLLFLGSPLLGSHRILTVLFGLDGIIKKLSFLDIHHSKKELVDIFSKLSGILALLPFTTSKEDDYANIAVWNKMRSAFEDTTWPIPNTTLLEQFKNYRDKILTALKGDIDYSNVYYIAGQDKRTPFRHFFKDGKLEFEYTKEGDQSVTWESGIPKPLIALNHVYYSQTTHGELANDSKLFSAIEELLAFGNTNKLTQTKPVFRDGVITASAPEYTDFDYSESGLTNTLFGMDNEGQSSVSQNPITVSLSHGDLSYASFPVLAGHFKNDGILYAEKAIDYNVNGMLSHKHQLGIYPGDIGTCEIIEEQNFFKGTIIIGLGTPGKLTPHLLSQSVELSITNHLLNLSNNSKEIKSYGISPLMIASGYGGLNIESSMKAIIEGINNANKNCIDLRKENYGYISHIEFIELYESNAISGLFAIKKIIDSDNDYYNIAVEEFKIKKLFGSKMKLPLENSEEWWSQITVKTEEKKSDKCPTKRLNFSLNTGDARVEENDLYTNTSLVDTFINQISIDNNWNEKTAVTLFEILIPNGFKETLKRKGNIIWQIDKNSAYYPWEILVDNAKNTKPFCIGSGMIRQLLTKDAQPKLDRLIEEKALIIADPQLENFINQLSGAAKEGKMIANLMAKHNYKNDALINATASQIIESLFSSSYKVLHLAGHGVLNTDEGCESGMAIGNNIFLTPSHIRQMSNLPELVFINCCHIGYIDANEERETQEQFKLAANIGTELIDKGVRVVIAAGWQVDDEDAEIFATEFYKKMFEGETFGKAVRSAREEIYRKSKTNNNTWGAYQCYGDPFYKLVNHAKRGNNSNSTEKDYIIEDEVFIDLYNLLNKLDVRDMKEETILTQLDAITNNRLKAKIESTRIIETEANIYYELGMYKKAYDKFDELKSSKSSKFSVSSLERHCNTECYNIYEQFKLKQSNPNSNLGIDSEMAKSALREVIDELGVLNTNNTATEERYSLIGSAYKRLAYVTKDDAKIKNYKNACDFYLKAYKEKEKSYPLNNYVIFKSILNFNSTENGENDKDEMIDWINKNKIIINSASLNMDYWTTSDACGIKLAELFLYEDYANEERKWSDLIATYQLNRAKYGSIGKKKAELYNLELIVDALQSLKKKDKKEQELQNSHAEILRVKIIELLEKLK